MLGEHRHRSLVSVHACPGENMGSDAIVDRPQQRSAAAHLVGKRREAQLYAFARVALGLTIERLMLAVLLEQDHRQKARPGKAARQNMKRRGRLRDPFAGAASELLADVLHDLPLPRNHFQRLGNVLAELRKLRRAAASAGGRSGDDHSLAWQMRRERLARRHLASEGANRRGLVPRCRSLVGGLVLSGISFELFELKLQLIEQPRLALVAWPENIPPQLLDGKPQMDNERLGARYLRARSCKLGVALANKLPESLDGVGKRISCAHQQHKNHKMLRL